MQVKMNKSTFPAVVLHVGVVPPYQRMVLPVAAQVAVALPGCANRTNNVLPSSFEPNVSVTVMLPDGAKEKTNAVEASHVAVYGPLPEMDGELGV